MQPVCHQARRQWRQFRAASIAIAVILSLSFLTAYGQNAKNLRLSREAQLLEGEEVPTGQKITPTAAPGAVFQLLQPDLPPPNADYAVGQAVTTTVSPDATTLLILTSGYNYSSANSNEFVFVYDITTTTPVKRQVLPLPYTFDGMTWNPNGREFYVSGGSSDNVHVFTQQNGAWAEVDSPIALGHSDTPGWQVGPVTAGLATNARGDRLVIANLINDSISIVDLNTRTKIAEVDLRPGKINPQQSGVPGGQYPFWVVVQGDEKAFISSQRDREIVVVDLTSATPTVLRRIPVKGQPNKMLLNKSGTLLFAAVDNSDTVVVIDTASQQVIEEIATIPRQFLNGNRVQNLKGHNPNSLALAPDERTLYVTNGGTNNVSVIELADREQRSQERKGLSNGKLGKEDKAGDQNTKAQSSNKSRTAGLIPTGWYPHSVSLNRDGSLLYVVNGKSNPGPNPGLYANGDYNQYNGDQYVLQLTKAGFLTVPVPTMSELSELTSQVAKNNRFSHSSRENNQLAVIRGLRHTIQHIIYVVKENRTYDQVLGDLEKGNGDPSIIMFGEPITPNHHQLARQFVTLDNFYQSGAVSADGWNWAVAARTTDFTEKTVPVNYGGRGFSYEWQGQNRNLNTAQGTVAARLAANPLVPTDPDILPGTADIAAPDSSDGDEGAGYLWDAALRARLSIRHYGQFTDWNLYYSPPPAFIPLSRTPFADGIIQAYATKASLQPHTDVYYRGFDMKLPDYWLFKEWEREFDGYVKNRNLPNLSFVALPHDHFGDFGDAIDGVNTPETQIADNDYALGLLIEKVADSPYKDNTLIFVTEDDAQDGPDHVDAHRTLGYVIGPYVKQKALVSTRYTTVNMIRTIGDILRMKPLGLYDGLAEPMTEVFDLKQKDWTYTARVPEVLRTTALPLPQGNARNSLPQKEERRAQAQPQHPAAYWIEQTKGLDFGNRDHLDSERFNRILWVGIKGEDAPYPTERHGRNLSLNRSALLKVF